MRIKSILVLLGLWVVPLAAQQVNFTTNHVTCTHTTTSSKSCALPHDTYSGDTAVIFAYWSGAGVTFSSASISPGSGAFSKVIDCAAIPGHGNDHCAWIVGKNLVRGATPSVTVNLSGAANIGVLVHILRGAHLTAPIDASATRAASSSTNAYTTPDLTTTSAGDLILSAWADFTVAGGLTPGSGMIRIEADGDYSAGDEGKLVSDAGTYPIAATGPSSTNAWVGASIAIKPAALPAVTDDVTVFEVDGSTQTGRPITHGRVFAQGEIPTGYCPRPKVGGVFLSSSNYQADVKSTWADGSVKFAVMSYKNLAGLTSGGSVKVSFEKDNSVGCNNSGYITTASSPSFDTFNSGLWDGSIVVNPAGGGTGKTVSAKAMLDADDPANNAWGSCKNFYWLKGPVVTAVVVQDCTSSSLYDFGWKYDSSGVMNSNAGVAFTGNSQYATFHPMFILYFYPALNAVYVEAIWELPWYGRLQDQLADVLVKKDATPTTVWPSPATHVGARRLLNDISAADQGYTLTSAGSHFVSTDVGTSIQFDNQTHIICSVTNSSTAVTCDRAREATTNATAFINLQVSQSRHKKVFWSGTAPGHIRIAHNFAYLKSTFAFPNYDPGFMADVDIDWALNGESTVAQYSHHNWATITDRGEVGGNSQITAAGQGYDINDEGAPLQKEELDYLYNMDYPECGLPNSACAKAWQMLTGESGAIDTGINAYDVVGGGGWWFGIGNVPFHTRDPRTIGTGAQTVSNFYYVPKFASINALDSDTCSDTTSCQISGSNNNATGRPPSRHAHSDFQWGHGGGCSGCAASLNGGFGGFSLMDHWLEYAPTGYALTGDYYELEESYFQASMGLTGHDPSTDPGEAGAGIFELIQSAEIVREWAWGIQAVAHAWFWSPDNTQELNFYKAALDSNYAVAEGVRGITGTNLTPTSTNPTCTSFNIAAANRWNWGRCGQASLCTTGACTPIAPSPLRHMSGGQGFSNKGGVAIVGCPGGLNGDGRIDTAKGGSEWEPWFEHYVDIVNALNNEMGYTNAVPFMQDQQKRLLDESQVSNYNPYLMGAYEGAAKDATSASGNCGPGLQNNEAFLDTWAKQKAAFTTNFNGTGSDVQNHASFDWAAGYDNFPCDDHGYSCIARAAATFVAASGLSSSDAGCPGGGCTASGLWNFARLEIPYSDFAPLNSLSCNNATTTQPPDQKMIKYALAPRSSAPGLLSDTCSITAPTAAQQINGTFFFTGTGVAGQGSMSGMTFTVDGFSIGTQSGVGPYSQSKDTTALSNGPHTASCSCTDTLSGSGTCGSISFTVQNGAGQSKASGKISGKLGQ